MSINKNSPCSPSFQRDLLALIPHLRAFARKLCGHRELAEDLVQDTLTKAWAARERFELGTNMKAWLFTILRHELYSHGRRAWRQVHWDEDKGETIPRPPTSSFGPPNSAMHPIFYTACPITSAI